MKSKPQPMEVMNNIVEAEGTVDKLPTAVIAMGTGKSRSEETKASRLGREKNDGAVSRFHKKGSM